MELVFILILLSFIGFWVILLFKLWLWILKKKQRKNVTLTILSILVISFIINHLFFKKMHFIQSKVYDNLYLVRYPEKNQELLHKAIKEKIKEHIKTDHQTGKSLVYTGSHGIYFYEYYKHIPFALFQDAGTYYFIENEEDLGGFVSEELGMYTQYRLAECYLEPCNIDATQYCCEINYFHEGEYIKVDTLKNLDLKKFDVK